MPPDILDYQTSADLVVDEGANVSLRCIARGSPEPSITWKRENGQPIYLHTGESGAYMLFLLTPSPSYSRHDKLLR